MFDTILVPTDGSDCARTAVWYAEDLASRYGAVVHGCPWPTRGASRTRRPSNRKAERAELAERACETLSERDISTRETVRTALPQ